jgi:uncharacterized membrane protein YkvA (DUF1232 family)
MANSFDKRFTASEMAAMRAAARDGERLGPRLFALLGKFARQLPFAEDALSGWFCARDPRTPARVRYTLMMALGYLVLPVDAIPDFLPLLGFSDDAAVIAAAIATVAGSITDDHREKARSWLKGA